MFVTLHLGHVFFFGFTITRLDTYGNCENIKLVPRTKLHHSKKRKSDLKTLINILYRSKQNHRT